MDSSSPSTKDINSIPASVKYTDAVEKIDFAEGTDAVENTDSVEDTDAVENIDSVGSTDAIENTDSVEDTNNFKNTPSDTDSIGNVKQEDVYVLFFLYENWPRFMIFLYCINICFNKLDLCFSKRPPQIHPVCLEDGQNK